MEELKRKIREIPDFPKPGILFYDLTTLMKDAESLRSVIDILTEKYREMRIDRVIGIEARGFIFGSGVAYNLGAGFVPVRKKGKLPAQKVSASHDLEYGQSVLEMHEDAVEAGQRVLIVDDLIATGGTAAATAQMVRQLGAKVLALAFVVELEFLNGREKLGDSEVFSILRY